MAGSGAQRALLLVLLAALACEGFAELLSCKDGVCSAPPPGPVRARAAREGQCGLVRYGGVGGRGSASRVAQFDGAKFEMCSCVSANFNEAANFVGNSYYYKIRNFSAEVGACSRGVVAARLRTHASRSTPRRKGSRRRFT
jgi:hypothetical protein